MLIPPHPPKRKRELDLKCKPSKQSIVAEKYKSQLFTKPTHLPKPVRNRSPQKEPNSTPVAAQPQLTNTTNSTQTITTTVLTPAMSTKTRDAIDALLMLGELSTTDKTQPPDDDNAILVPILGAKVTQNNNGSAKPTETKENPTKDLKATALTAVDNQGSENPNTGKSSETNKETSVKPLPGTVLGTAIKTDVKTQNPESEPKPAPVKKELSFKQYGIKRKYKSTCKFKCKLCPAELPSVQDYNNYYLENHPPQPCPDCTRVFISPRTLAKHRYTHADYMFECNDCGCGFTFESWNSQESSPKNDWVCLL